MTLTHILVFSAAALAVGLLANKRWQGWLILVISVVAIYWLQPASPIRHLDFWLPTATLGLVVLSWAVTRTSAPQKPGSSSTPVSTGSNGLAGLIVVLIVLGIGLTRYTGQFCCLVSSIPPEISQIGLAIGLILLLVVGLFRFSPSVKIGGTIAILILLGIFLVLKNDWLVMVTSTWLRFLSGQNTSLTRVTDLRWLGYSYIAFRLIHTLRDRQTGRLPSLSLQAYINFVIFFPSLAAGPIDRVERFSKDATASPQNFSEMFNPGGERVVFGLFKKFVIADALALVALNPDNFAHVTSTLWMWVLVYTYALRIYFDFSGYTDIAIGLGCWLGIKLPENFDHPYLKPNLTAFWNSWHISLAQWFRAYFFNPLTRSLRSMKRPLPTSVVILAGQFGTMILIGLWHGITWNFLLWGAWQGIGLFLHNRWLNFSRSHLAEWAPPGWLRLGLVYLGTFLTFNYVTLGWVWFALPEPIQSLATFQKLFGL